MIQLRDERRSRDLNRQPEVEATPAPSEVKVIDEAAIQEYTQNYKEELRKLPEVEKLTALINVEDPNSILTFGKEASEGISKVSDTLLSTMQSIKSEEAGEMIVQLTKIMKEFDIDEIKDGKDPGFLSKLLGKAKNMVEEMFQKYETMGTEVDKIYVILKKYERDINKSNDSLRLLYDTNIDYYEELEKYIVAGEMAIEEITDVLIPQFQEKAATSGNQMDQLTVQSLQTTLQMLEQRVYDLRIAENVAMQSIPMIQGIQYGNFNLVRKINSAFIITLPIFKQCLAQAIMLKRQELQAKSLKALDDTTNELLQRNAQNMVSQTQAIARMSGTSSVSMETLEKTWQTIMNGIEETAQIQKDQKIERENNTKRLEEIKFERSKRNIKSY